MQSDMIVNLLWTDDYEKEESDISSSLSESVMLMCDGSEAAWIFDCINAFQYLS